MTQHNKLITPAIKKTEEENNDAPGIDFTALLMGKKRL